jgi:hypothetical protein
MVLSVQSEGEGDHSEGCKPNVIVRSCGVFSVVECIRQQGVEYRTSLLL